VLFRSQERFFSDEGIDVSSLIKKNDMFSAFDTTVPFGDFVSDLQNIAIIVAGLAYFVYEKRPRGSARSDLLDIKKSTVPNANLGVFATKFIPEGTKIGEFPGYIRNNNDVTKIKRDEKAFQAAQKYWWAISDEIILDPTSDTGVLELELKYAFGLIKVDTTMARVNEPPRGMDVNAYTKVIGTTVEVISERDIFAGEEIFLDYGFKYDRADYDQEKLVESQRAKALEEDIMMRLQPVTRDSVAGSNLQVDQDTSNPDGFLSKLAKQDSLLKNAGILSPEEAAAKFAKLGSSMFTAGGEDQELIDSLLGKTPLSAVTDKIPEQEKTGSKLKERDDDALLMKGLYDQLGGSDVDKVSSSRLSSSDEKSEIDSFMSVFGKVPLPESSSTKSISSSSSSDVQPNISEEEAEDLKRRIDNLSDEQMEKVFAKMRKSLSEKTAESMFNLQKAAASSSPSTSKMPRSQPLDPKIRQKYNSELTAVENALEELYNDPLKVWQEMVTNPDKFGGKDKDDINKIIDDDKGLQ